MCDINKQKKKNNIQLQLPVKKIKHNRNSITYYESIVSQSFENKIEIKNRNSPTEAVENIIEEKTIQYSKYG